MKENRQQPEELTGMLNEEEFADLDRELAQMAQDVPDMPADFHARWTEQVRAEAGEKKDGARTERRRQWRYVLSAAAVFVFLIGGTLLTRGNGKKAADNAAPRGAAGFVSVYETAAATGKPEDSVDAEADTAGGAVNASIAVGSAPAEAEVPEAAEETIADEDAEAVMPPANSAVFLDAAPAGGGTEEAADDAAESGESAEDGGVKAAGKAASPESNAAMLPAATAAATREATATPAPEPAAAAEDAAVPTEEAISPADLPQDSAEAGRDAEEAGTPGAEQEESGFVSFLKDLGIFTLKAAGVAAAGAALAFLVALVHRKIKGRKP